MNIIKHRVNGFHVIGDVYGGTARGDTSKNTTHRLWFVYAPNKHTPYFESTSRVKCFKFALRHKMYDGLLVFRSKKTN